jgi:hypothetical protein
VLAISLIIGLVMVLVFRFTSDQSAIHVVKDRLKAHLLALRLFQDQISVVMRSYGGILLGTLQYLRLTIKPLLIVILPLVLVVVQSDRYLGLLPVSAGQPFLVKAQLANPDALRDSKLVLPEGLSQTAPAVHDISGSQVVWRIVASRDGRYGVIIQIGDQQFSKSLIVGSGLCRLSPIRLRREFLRRMLFSAEAPLPDTSAIQSIEIQYPAREIPFARMEWNWIWLFFVLSIVFGFLWKSLLGVEV